jgi:ring-1,2-phenylacetyl-CoA epoxidase subunit PaaC
MPRAKCNMPQQLPEKLKQPLAQLLLALADDKLMLGHRNSDWTGLGPILEEDIAFSHLAQDEMAHAQTFYEFISSMIQNAGGADALAFGRPPEEYRCASIVEIADEFDWSTALARKFFCDHFDRLRLRALSESSDKPLADLSRRVAAEEELHVQHVDQWMQRLGRGTVDSHDRMQRALDALLPHAVMLFEPIEGEDRLVAAKVIPFRFADRFDEWSDELAHVAARSNLILKFHPPYPARRGGRHGVHTPHLKELLDEMCEVYRTEPGAAW